MRKIVRKLRPVGRGTVRGRLYDFREYPGAILDLSSSSAFAGQVFALPSNDQKILPLLDAYESFFPQDLKKSLFIRKQCHVAMLDGRVLQCWIYEYNRAIGSARVIQGGDYLK